MSRIFNKKLISFALSIIIGGLIWNLFPPEGVTTQAMHMFAIFIFTVIGIILRPVPIGTFAFLGLVLTVTTKTLTFEQAFSGFVHPIVWLIVIAFFISRGFIKTGLGERIAYIIIKYLGKNTLGMAYGMLLTDLILAPAIPSIVARVGGIIYPIVNSLSKAFGSEPYSHPRRLGAYLIKATFQGSIITSGMFMTAMAGNPLIADLAKSVGVNITWGSWAVAASVPGLACLIVIPLFLYKFYPPETKETPDAKKLAIKKLKEMGKVRIQEWIMIFSFILLITLWIIGPYISLSATVAALIGLVILLLSSVLTWDDVIKEKGAWNTLMWFATLIMMATYINRLGLIGWFSNYIGTHVSGFHWFTAFIILSFVYFYSHYFFASLVAHIGSMYSAFLVLMVALGAPPVISALTLGFFSNLMGGLTHYGCGPAPIYFGSGYLKVTDWWQFGLYASIINIVIYFTIGSGWWKILGHL
ncbi:MAG: DASS family sodium-coupled anion symporter [Candidatus Neptunochlamydia sp.]|nr:DASS family sodium-coupled anion symporter [Candidatus Neptunochlamydia sp.]